MAGTAIIAGRILLGLVAGRMIQARVVPGLVLLHGCAVRRMLARLHGGSMAAA